MGFQEPNEMKNTYTDIVTEETKGLFKGTVAWDFLVWGFFGEPSPTWALIPTLKQLTFFLQIQWVIGEFCFTSRIKNAESNYFPRFNMRQVITCRV